MKHPIPTAPTRRRPSSILPLRRQVLASFPFLSLPLILGLLFAGMVAGASAADSKRVIRRQAKETLTPVELDLGETLRFRLRDGSERTLKLLATDAAWLWPGRDMVRFEARVEVDGRPMRMVRYLPAQESFYEPYVIDGVRIWFDAVQDIFDKEVLREAHGPCRPGKAARFALMESQARICPQILSTWYPNDEYRIRVQNCYRGNDVWMGPYGRDAHGGLDINAARGSGLYAPFDLDDHFLRDAVVHGDKNNRWRGFRTWPDGSTWMIHTAHLIGLTLPERGPLAQGTHYARTAGVAVGSDDHTHFIFSARDSGREEILLDPWILFRQIFEDGKARDGHLRADMEPMAPARVGDTLAFSSAPSAASSRPGRGAGPLRFFWTFGDGGSAAGPAPRHAFPAPGLYPVTLIVDDGRTRAARTQHIAVSGPRTDRPTLSLSAPEEASFRLRPDFVQDVYGDVPEALYTLAFQARAERPKAWAKTVKLINAGAGELPEAQVSLSNVQDIGAKAGKAPRWLRVTRTGAGNNQILQVETDASGLAPGVYSALVEVEAPGALNSRAVFQVELRVAAGAAPTFAKVDDAGPGFYRTPYFWVGRGPGGGSQGWGGRTLSNGTRTDPGEFVRFTPDLRPGRYRVVLADENPHLPGQRLVFRVRHAAGWDTVRVAPDSSRMLGSFEMPGGTDGYVEAFASDNARFHADAIEFRSESSAPPPLVAAPAEVREQITRGYVGPTPTPFLQVQNPGAAEVAVTISSGAPWLTTPVTRGKLPPGTVSSLPLKVKPQGLKPGLHVAQVTLKSSRGFRLTVPFMLTVSDTPAAAHVKAYASSGPDSAVSAYIDSSIARRGTSHGHAGRTTRQNRGALAAVHAAGVKAPAVPLVSSEPQPVPPIAKPIRIDGDAAEWQAISAMRGGERGEDIGLKLAWRPDGLYGLITYADTGIFSEPEVCGRVDCVELFFEPGNEKSPTMHPGAAQYYLFPPGLYGPHPVRIAPSDTSRHGLPLPETAARPMPGGYTIEFRFPARAFGAKTLAAGKAFGFNYSLSDDGAEREYLASPKDRKKSFAVPASWGALVLAAPETGGAPGNNP